MTQKSFIEINGQRIEGDSRLVMTYIIPVRNALDKILNGEEKFVWVRSGGYYNSDPDGHPDARVRVVQGVYLHAHSNVRYEIVADDFSAELFEESALGDDGKSFIEKYSNLFDSDEDDAEEDAK